jgi:hypothetical protein
MKSTENKSPETLPKTLAGTVCEQHVRCGKPNCHCAHGEGHIAYYRFWREGGQLRKCYIKRADLAEVRAACEARRQANRKFAEGLDLWRKLDSFLRGV